MNILTVKWINWNQEYYADYNNSFYNLKKINFVTQEWEDICYIDYHNNIVYRPNENEYGNLVFLKNNAYHIKWNKMNNNFLNNILNIDCIKNTNKKYDKIKWVKNNKNLVYL